MKSSLSINNKDSSQLGVLKGIITGAVICVSALGSVILLVPEALIPDGHHIHPIGYALRWDLAILTCLIVSIGLLARHRFFTQEDIDGSGLAPGTPRAVLLQSILQNTLEQVVIAVIAHLTWASIMPSTWQGAIPIAVGLFVVGRILFALGYSRGAPARSLGFALTFYPTVLMTLTMMVSVFF